MRRSDLSPVDVSVLHHLLASIPEDMGSRLRHAAFSPNIKERLDFSCALTATDGGMAAQASHIPVHLGSTHVTARYLLAELSFREGDVILLNDPYRGGTHLPDVTLFAPVFFPRVRGAAMGTLARAHHADVGGGTPGSMGPATDLFGEGLVVPPVRLVKEGRLDQDLLSVFLANSRTPEERRGDLLAQLASVTYGRERLLEVAREQGPGRVLRGVAALRDLAAAGTRRMLLGLKNGIFRARASMDGGTTPVIAVSITKRGDSIHFDFDGTDPAVEAPFNANEAITLACVFYVVRLLLDEDTPTNSGCLDPVTVSIPSGCLVGAVRPSPVAGGNVETSQRIVDVLLEALAKAKPGGLPASSQGTMNNLTIGGRRADGTSFTFYETMAGGAGAGPRGDGASALHTHMTNTLNTPIEALEAAFPVIVRAYRHRDRSGGSGRHRGGDGLVRDIELRLGGRVTVMAARRREGARGAEGGSNGLPGVDRWIRHGKARSLPADGSLLLLPGDRIRIETPGGGGFGRQKAKKAKSGGRSKRAKSARKSRAR